MKLTMKYWVRLDKNFKPVNNTNTAATKKPLLGTWMEITDCTTVCCGLQKPTVVTGALSALADVTVTIAGEVTTDGGTDITAYGMCWNTTGTPTVDDDITTDGAAVEAFSSDLTSLTAETTYFARAYATNARGTSYGTEISFTTAATA